MTDVLARQGRCHVLVVDDDTQIQALLKEALERRHHTVSIEPHAEGALRSLRTGRYDVVLMDVRLPGMSGLDAIDEILRLDHRTPIIVMTAHGTREMAVDAVRRGAYDYCRKPFRIDELEIVMRRALEKRRLVGELERLREDLASGIGGRDGRQPQTLGERVGQIERAFVLDALARAGGVQAAAARLLGVSERSVWHLVKKHGIEVARLKQTVGNGTTIPGSRDS
jgi:two-component system response regulator AtoC